MSTTSSQSEGYELEPTSTKRSSSLSDKEIEAGGSTTLFPTSNALQGPLLQKPTIRGFGEKLKDKALTTFTTKKGFYNLASSIFPVLEWLPNYQFRECIRGDLTAGFTVGVMLVPQSMAYAIVAGLPPIYGLFTALVPIFIYALLGTSRQLSVGPVAVVSLLLFESVSPMYDPSDVENYVRVAGALALMSGVINAICGIFQLGFLVSLLSPSVVTGFTSASAIIIFCSQLKDCFGVTIPASVHMDYFYQSIYYVCKYIATTNYIAFLICFVGGVSLFYLQKWKPIFPWALILLVIDTVISFLVIKYGHQTLKIVKTVPKGLPAAHIPYVSHDEFVSLIPTAIIIAFVGFMESISISKKYAQMAKFDLRPSQEFFALGTANIVGSFFGSYPSTGSFSRTAVKFNTGSTSQVSAFVAGTVVLFSLLFLTPLFYYIPKAALASIVMVAVIKLVEFEKMLEFWRTSKEDFMTFLVTFCFVLGLGVDIGIGVGVGFSLLIILYKSSRPNTVQLANIGGKVVPNYRNIKRNPNSRLEPHTVIARIDSFIYFANISHIEAKLYKYLMKNEIVKPIKFYIIEFSTIHDIDSAGVLMLRNFKENLDRENITLILAGVRGHVSDAFIRSKFHEEIGEENFHFTVADAVEHAQKLLRLQQAEEERRRLEEELNPKKPQEEHEIKEKTFADKVFGIFSSKKKGAEAAGKEKDVEERGGKEVQEEAEIGL